MTHEPDSAIAQANRQTAADCARACENAARRSGQVLVDTIILFDGDPAEYRQLLIDSFDAEAARRA